MISRQSTTILLITADQIVRADFKGGQVAELWQQPRPMVDDLPALVETALRLGGKRRRKMWVLTTELWSQALPVTADATRGLSAEELQRVLGFEAEPLSGLSAFESVVGHKPLGSDGYHRHFWVVQLPAWQLAQIAEAVQQSGNSLAGVAHPGGVPRPLTAEAAGQSWGRVELWSDSIVVLQAEAGKPPETHVISGSPAQDIWRSDATKWLANHGPVESRLLLVARGSDATRGLGDETEVLDLENQTTLSGWLGAWAQVLADREPGVPLVRPAAQPMPVQSQALISAALASVLLAALLTLHGTIKTRLADVNAEVEKLEERTSQFENFDKQIQQRSDRISKLEAESDELLADLHGYEAALVAQRGRMARLLTTLAQRRPEHLMIQKIEHSGGELTITGASLGPEPANELAVLLDHHVRTLGWRVGPPRQQAGQRRGDGNPWRFTLELVDTRVTATAEQLAALAELAELEWAAGGRQPQQGASR